MGEGSLGRDGYHQPLAALGAAATQNVDAILGAHPRTEAVGTFTLDLARLISAFHDMVSLLREYGCRFSAKGIVKHRWRGKSRKRKIPAIFVC